MAVKFLNKSKDGKKISFVVSNTTPAMANLIRKVIIEEVPTMAIDEVEFKKNSSVLYDEIVAHRLGLVPLTTDLKSYMIPDECKCNGEGCNRCQLLLTLSSKKTGYVYTDSFKSKDPKVVPVFDDMPLVKLTKNQDIELIATATLGRGKHHVKWSPGLAWYSYEPKIKVNKGSKEIEAFKDKYPPMIFDKNGKIDESLIVEPNIINACEGVCEDIIKVEYDPNSLIFYIESWGQLKPKDMVITALDVIREKLESAKKEIK